MIDFIILEQMTAFAVIMQKHPGWVGESPVLQKILCWFKFQMIYYYFSICLFPLFAGFIQKTILESVGCIWFNRNDLRDREVTARK
jgi:glycerol-3-phosphate O-acyltransferase 3/4